MDEQSPICHKTLLLGFLNRPSSEPFFELPIGERRWSRPWVRWLMPPRGRSPTMREVSGSTKKAARDPARDE